MVGLVPHTLGATTFDALKAGQAVNLEADQIARYVARLIEHQMSTDPKGAGLTIDDLVDAGYLDPGEGRR